MTVDFDDVLLCPIYDGDVASDATLLLASGASYSALRDGTALRVIDDTAGLAVTQPARGATLTIETIRPVAFMRQASLTALGLAITDLEGGQLTIHHDGVPDVGHQGVSGECHAVRPGRNRNHPDRSGVRVWTGAN
jgi:hypothetical protein